MKGQKTKCKICKAAIVKRTWHHKYCSYACYRKGTRRNKAGSSVGYTHYCEVCTKPFVKTKRHQKFCSTSCYRLGWARRHPEKHKARSRNRRRANPSWYREREPRYYQTYRAKQISSKPWRYLLQSARLRAKEKGWTFELDDRWAEKRWTGRCAITGLAFIKNKTCGPHPFSATIDRINSKKGYTKRNTRFVLWGCNALKGTGSDKDMRRIAKAIICS